MQGDAVAKEKNNLAQLDIAYADNIKNENKRNEELAKDYFGKIRRNMDSAYKESVDY
jgi:hypothetical protein